MKRISLAVLAGLWLCAGTLSAALAADVSEQEVTPRVKKIMLEPEKTLIEKGVLRYLTALTVGYDNNTHLDSRRDGDAYTQQFFRAQFSTPLSAKTQGQVDYEFMNLLYAGESSLGLMRNGLRLGLEHALDEKVTLSGGYTFDAIEYTRTGTDDYLDNALYAKYHKKLNAKLYHSLAYELLDRAYEKRYIRTPAAVDSDKERNDLRNTFDYEIGAYLPNDLIRLNLQWFRNNSNERYLDYYDYDSYKYGVSLTHLFDKKLSGYLSLSRQRRSYDHRTLVNNSGCRQHEDTYLLMSALYYSYSKSLTFGLSWTYRENHSNEPVDRYSGSLVALSTYYRF